MRSLLPIIVLLFSFTFAAAAAPPLTLEDDGTAWDAWVDAVDRAAVDAYGHPDGAFAPPLVPGTIDARLTATARAVLHSAPPNSLSRPVAAAGVLRARSQQALVLEMADAVRDGDVARAQVWRCRLTTPRGASSTDGALILQTLPTRPAQRADAARALAREAIAWQTTRARQLIDEATRSTRRDVPMPGRLIERFAEAVTLADVPAALVVVAGIDERHAAADPAALMRQVDAAARLPWSDVPAAIVPLRRAIESALPSVLTEEEKGRRERLVLKLTILAPREYAAGVRDGQVTVPFEYREAVTFTAQARQMAGELAPLWLKDGATAELQAAVEGLDARLARADELIAAMASSDQLDAVMSEARELLEGPIGVTLRRSGSTSEIVEEVMLETRSLLNASLAAALAGRWGEAEELRLEAYTTFDPDLEARLMPRDPQLAMDIERMLLDGIDHPGIKVLLDRRVGGRAGP